MWHELSSEWSTLLFESLSAGEQMSEIFDRLCIAGDVQFALFDLDNNMLLCAPNSEENALHQQLFSKGLLIEHDLDVRNKMLKVLMNGKITEFLPGEVSDTWTVVQAVYMDNVPDGIVVVRYDRTRTSRSEAENLLSLLLQVYKYFHDECANTYQGGFEQSFSKLLLQDSKTSSTLLDMLLDTYRSKADFLTPNYLQLDFQAMYGSISQNDLSRIGSDVSSVFPRSYHLIKNGELLVLLHGLQGAGELEKVVGQLQKLTEKYHLRCGISLMFSDLENRIHYKSQARIALQVRACIRPDAFVCRADQMLPEVMLYGAAELTGSNVLILHEILELARYDRENQTNYLETLKAYLSYGKRTSATAKALFIDRSTLKYRLEKIMSVINMDIDDPAIATILDLSITMYNLQQKLFL